MRQDVFSLAEGEAVIHWPTPLSPDSIADLEEWLDLVKRKIKLAHGFIISTFWLGLCLAQKHLKIAL